jgi:hypothetical protein
MPEVATATPVSFSVDIKPLFRDTDRSMPWDARRPAAQVELFANWIAKASRTSADA